MKVSHTRARAGLTRGASLFCVAWLGCMQPVFAQVASPKTDPAKAADDSAATGEDGTITVTGTRLANGFSAPTPITIASAEDRKSVV